MRSKPAACTCPAIAEDVLNQHFERHPAVPVDGRLGREVRRLDQTQAIAARFRAQRQPAEPGAS